MEPDDEETPVVLVVEDNADMRAYIRAHLEAHYTIQEARDGAEGLALAQTHVPDLVLSDIMMPKLDGLALCDALRADLRTSHIPIVLLTAKGEVEHRIAGFESGADAYVPKPFDADELRVRVRTLIESRRRLRRLFQHRSASDQPADAPSEPTGEAPSLPARELAFLQEVQTEIEHHLAEPGYHVDQLAEAFLMGPRQLARKLKALTDETPGALLRRCRLERARDLLCEGASVKEAAYSSGFSSTTGFSRAFTNTYGVPPSAYTSDLSDRD